MNKINIYCPECGSCDYSVTKKNAPDTSGKITIGKCNTGGCDLLIEFDGEQNDPQRYENFEELKSFVHSKYDIKSKFNCNCH